MKSIFLFTLVVSLIASSLNVSSTWGQTICVNCVNVRIGRPLIVRGPTGSEIDTTFNEIQLPSGARRGFTAKSTTYAITGQDPWSMGGSGTAVLSSGLAGTYSECGRWLSDTKMFNGIVKGFIHAEQSCLDPQTTHMSMAFAESYDYGMHWNVIGQIITGTDYPTPGEFTGEGGCTVVDGNDGYYYAYCLRGSDWNTIVARAPIASPGPPGPPGSGKPGWSKYYLTSWSQPGLGGYADSLGGLGHSVGRWVDYNNILLFNEKAAGGLKISFSSDKTTFTPMSEPLIPIDDHEAGWIQPSRYELITYPSVMNYTNVTNQITSPFLLTYMYIQPNSSWDYRYLVFRDVNIWISPTPVHPQVGIALSRWYNATLQDRWSTTAAVPGNYTSYIFEGTLGYLMTKQPTLPSVKLEDCVADLPGGRLDHLLTNDGMCESEGYTRLRTAGWVYQYPQENTVPVYRCKHLTPQYHFASTDYYCEGLGTSEWLLGYALQY